MGGVVRFRGLPAAGCRLKPAFQAVSAGEVRGVVGGSAAWGRGCRLKPALQAVSAGEVRGVVGFRGLSAAGAG